MNYLSQYFIISIPTIATVLTCFIPAIVLMISEAKKNLSESKRNTNKNNLLFIFINFCVTIGLIFIDNFFAQVIMMLIILLMNLAVWLSIYDYANSLVSIYLGFPILFYVGLQFSFCFIDSGTNCFSPNSDIVLATYLIYCTIILTATSIYTTVIIVRNNEVDYITIPN